jgi:hypothetical protein
MPINAHSFHEICSAAAGHVQYTAGQYIPLAPWSESFVASLAVKAGIDPQLIGATLKTAGK